MHEHQTDHLSNNPTSSEIYSTKRKLLYLKSLQNHSDFNPGIVSDGWDVFKTSDIREAGKWSDIYDFPVALVDVGLFSDQLSLKRWEDLFSSHNGIKWVALIPTHEQYDDKVQKLLIRQQFFDSHTLPVDPQWLLSTLSRAVGSKDTYHGLWNRGKPSSERFGIVGSSSVMKAFFRQLEKVASVDAPVLIGGESGSGKELAAAAIHQQSYRTKKHFVAVNCCALPANLIQSELFGHEKGAFTGAHKRKIGMIEASAGGTIFLDEIGDLPLDLQVNLLRFLQEGTIDRVGGSQSIKVDSRVIAATHVDLDKAISEGKFREDLYYRLNVVKINVPALRQRGSDIIALAQHFFEKYTDKENPQVSGFNQCALDAMCDYDWPGNVRELINKVRHAMVMSDNSLITAEDMGFGNLRLDDVYQLDGDLRTLTMARESAERQAITRALHRGKQNISMAAKILDISRATLYRLLEKYQIASKSRV